MARKKPRIPGFDTMKSPVQAAKASRAVDIIAGTTPPLRTTTNTRRAASARRSGSGGSLPKS
jgi:hypothetical protein